MLTGKTVILFCKTISSLKFIFFTKWNVLKSRCNCVPTNQKYLSTKIYTAIGPSC